MLSGVLMASGCAKKESAVDKAVEGTKDALDIRDHEKLKDAGEDLQDAAIDVVEDVKDSAPH
jgi:hypothetical protein